MLLDRILVTGATGFVGSRIARRLALRGVSVSVLVRERGLHTGLDHPNIYQQLGSFHEPEVAHRAVQGVGAVVHAAATFGPGLFEARQINAAGTAALAAAARAAGCRRFVHISTLAVHPISRHDAVIDEDSPLKTEGDAYGVTKAEAEIVLRVEAKRGLPVTILRPSAILGAHPTSTWGTKIPRAISRGQIPLRGEGRNRQPWVHVEDLVDAVELLLTASGPPGRIYSLVAGHWEWRTYLDDVRGWFSNAPPPQVLPPASPADYFIGTFRADRIRLELGYAPRRSYVDGMVEAAAQFRLP